MLFHHKQAAARNTFEQWREQWLRLVPPECRDVPITLDGQTVVAFIKIGHTVMMLQDGLLMIREFFDCCEFFQKAGFHVVWLMRCTQDVENGYLKLLSENSRRCRWLWRSPTTNFGRWTGDSRNATILLQYRELEDPTNIAQSNEHVLQRVVWADSDRPEEMIPGRTKFNTVALPATPSELRRWLEGEAMSKLQK